MHSWWGKSSSKDAKKKANKESFIDSLQRRFKNLPEGKANGGSRGSHRHSSDRASEMGSQSRPESRSPSPSRKYVSRCQSFGDRGRAQPLPLPGLHLANVERTDSGIGISPKPKSEKASKTTSFLPLPKSACIRNKLNMADLDADLVYGSVSSDGSCGSDDDLGDSSHIHATDYDRSARNPANIFSRSVMLKEQSSISIHTSKEAKKPDSLSFGNLTSPSSPKRKPLGSHVQNLQVPYNGAFSSCPDSSMSSPSKSPLRAFGAEKVISSAFWAGKGHSDVNLLGFGPCSCPGSGYNSGQNSVVGDVSGQLLWQQCKASPECSPIPSPRKTSPGPSSRVQSGAVTPIHPRVGGAIIESQASWPDEGKQQSHPLPLPPVTVSNSLPFSHSNSAAASPSLPRSPGRAESPAIQESRWKKGRLLGRGTFGHVYVGFNSESGEMCAMKEVTLFSDDAKSKESAKQLMQEVALLSRLQHPNIVQYYGSETVGDRIYIYLEYVSGGSIYKILQEYGPLGESAIRSYTQQILSGLAYLHSKNTVHRDIKGANILVDPNGRVKLADFGMAKHITGQSCLLSFKGSPYWMAPEVITNSNGCNLAVDIWSLGCTVVEMATTKPPWSQLEGAAAMFKIGNGKDLPPIPDHLSEEGKDFIRQCLQRNPLHRPTAAQLLDHSFLKSAAPLDRPIKDSEPTDAAVTNGVKALGISPARTFPGLESERLAVHSSRVSKTVPYASDIHISRNVSCPVSPIGSPLLHSRSPPNFGGRMSPSPMSSPRTTSGSSTPLTGGIGAIPCNHVKQPAYWQDRYGNISKSANGIYINGPSHHDSNPDLFQGMHLGNHIFTDSFPSDNEVPSTGVPLGMPRHGRLHDEQSVLADRVARQLLRDPGKINPRLDLSPTSPLPSRTGGV